jgi:hypothetical protein
VGRRGRGSPLADTRSRQVVGDLPIPRGPHAGSAIGCRASAESTGHRGSAISARLNIRIVRATAQARRLGTP